MKIVADECLDYGIIRSLRENGVTVFSISEEIASIKDTNVLEIANEKGWMLLTEDRDFGELVFRLNQAHHGIVYIKVKGLERKIKIERVVSIVLEHYEQLLNAFTVITNEKMKIRR
jgi:predicted nuclease of predicted toxin-antitoxin system